MMIKIKHLLLSTFFVCTPALAGKLMISETLKVLEINGIEHESSFFEKSTEFAIKPGEQKLLLKYQEFFEDDDENFATIRSKPFLFSFIAKENQDYKLATPSLDSESEGKVFAKKPRVILTNNQAQVVESQVNLLTATAVTAPTAVSSGVTVSSPNNEKSTTADSSQTTSSVVNKNQPTALSMLNYWWQQASEAEKQAFLSTINK